jgi:hypothetical protein
MTAAAANYSEFDDVTDRRPGWAGSKKAGLEIYRLATKYQLAHEELARRECQYFGVINGTPIRVSVFDRDVLADLAALRSAISDAEQIAA